MNKAGDEQKKAREEWLAGAGRRHLERISAIFERGSKKGPFMHGANPGAADFHLYSVMCYLTGPYVEHVPHDIFTVSYPRLAAVSSAILALPSVQEWMKQHPDC